MPSRARLHAARSIVAVTLLFSFAIAIAVAIGAVACGGSLRAPSDSSGEDASADSGAVTVVLDATRAPDVSVVSVDSGPADADAGCDGLQCQIPACDAATTTRIQGRVVDPAGRVPIYDVAVYVPNAPDGALPDVPHGPLASPAPTCECSVQLAAAHPVAAATSGIDGTFVLTGAPAGHDIPLVVQIGAWRREIIVPAVAPCEPNDVGDVRLPRSGSDGPYASLPNIAVSTGGGDALECLLTRLGVAPSEFTNLPADPTRHVHIFQGAGGHVVAGQTVLSSASTLWDDASSLMPFDLVLLSCEGGPTANPNPTALADYLTAGGRVYAEHGHAVFLSDPTAFPDLGTWTPGGYGGAITTDVDPTTPQGAALPTGVALGAWLSQQGVAGGAIPIVQGFYDFLLPNDPSEPPWISTAPGITPASAQMFVYWASVPDVGWAAPDCAGRLVFSDVHQGSSSPAPVDYTSSPNVPDGCASTQPLTPSELAIAFALFDLESCTNTPMKGPPPLPDE